MNEFAAKKLGEVLAFCNAGIEILKKGSVAVTDFEQVKNSSSHLSEQAGKIEKLAEKHGVGEITVAKSEKTAEKLLKMAELYIGDEWDNPAELLEWFGFFEGAAIIHWKLVEGVAKQIADQDMINLADSGVSLHTDLLAEVASEISAYASKKV